MSQLLSGSHVERLDRISDPWELLEELSRHPSMRVRAAYYSRYVALAANKPMAQQQMLTHSAHRVFHVLNQNLRLDLERSRLLSQVELRSAQGLGRPMREAAEVPGSKGGRLARAAWKYSYSYPHTINVFQEVLIICGRVYNIAIVQMAPRKKRGRTGSQKSSGPNQGIADRSKRPDSDLDRLGESRQAVNMILASWALRELIAQRALEETHV
jgi:hypothetical protein